MLVQYSSTIQFSWINANCAIASVLSALLVRCSHRSGFVGFTGVTMLPFVHAGEQVSDLPDPS